VWPVALVALVIAAAPRPARAEVLFPDPDERSRRARDFWAIDKRQYGLGTANMYLRYAHSRDGAPLSGLTDLVVGGISARALYGKRVGYGFGMGLEIGGGGAPGFAFAYDLFPAGVGVSLGATGYLGAFFGITAGGVSGRIPFTVTLPSELRLEVDVGRDARLGALFAMAWAPGSPARRGGSALASFADETTIAFSIRFGETFVERWMNIGRGYFVRAERRDQMQTALYGVAFGVEIDVAQ
jgi:hypothetical protein